MKQVVYILAIAHDANKRDNQGRQSQQSGDGSMIDNQRQSGDGSMIDTNPGKPFEIGKTGMQYDIDPNTLIPEKNYLLQIRKEWPMQ